MHKITVEAAFGQQLGESLGQVVLCDADDRALGFFSPLQDRPRLEDLQLDPPLSIAETEILRQKNRTGKPLEDILRVLDLNYLRSRQHMA